MPKAYWITTYHSISDISKVEAYAKLAGPAVEACGGQYLARGVAQAVYEAGIAERTVLSVFPSLDAAIKAHDSQGYGAAYHACRALVKTAFIEHNLFFPNFESFEVME